MPKGTEFNSLAVHVPWFALKMNWMVSFWPKHWPLILEVNTKKNVVLYSEVLINVCVFVQPKKKL